MKLLFTHKPVSDLNTGMPDSAEMPAPVSTTIFLYRGYALKYAAIPNIADPVGPAPKYGVASGR